MGNRFVTKYMRLHTKAFHFKKKGQIIFMSTSKGMSYLINLKMSVVDIQLIVS